MNKLRTNFYLKFGCSAPRYETPSSCTRVLEDDVDADLGWGQFNWFGFAYFLLMSWLYWVWVWICIACCRMQFLALIVFLSTISWIVTYLQTVYTITIMYCEIFLITLEVQELKFEFLYGICDAPPSHSFPFPWRQITCTAFYISEFHYMDGQVITLPSSVNPQPILGVVLFTGLEIKKICGLLRTCNFITSFRYCTRLCLI